VSSVTHERACIANVSRFHGLDAPETALARRDLRAANLEAAIRRELDAAPSPTTQQKSRLRALLSPAIGFAEREAAVRLDDQQ
jgi:hypothetical protein